VLQVRRFPDADMIFDELTPEPARTIVDPLDLTRRRTIADGAPHEDLLVPIFREGKRVYELPPIEEIRTRGAAQLERFHPGVKRFVNPHRYPVGLEAKLYDLKTRLILEARGATAGRPS
jgi:nicotinate phosphoribosyltransferase